MEILIESISKLQSLKDYCTLRHTFTGINWRASAMRIKSPPYLFFLSLIFSFSFLTGIKPKEDVVEFARKRLIKGNQSRIEQAFFSPSKENPVKKIMLGLIRNEKKSILASLFRLTDPDITEELLQAAKRGVKICLIGDLGAFLDKHEKFTLLASNNIDVRYFEKYFAILHHKYWLFKDNFLPEILVSGSANATLSGLSRNEENIIVTNSRMLFGLFKQNFEELKERTIKGLPPQSKTNELLAYEKYKTNLPKIIKRTLFSLKVR